MSNEPNEIPDELAGAEQRWRRLLREPEALPGQGLADKDMAWDKLFERLNARPRRRFFGYRFAAACILVLLIPAARLFQDRPASGRRLPVAEKVRPMVPVTVTRPSQPVVAPSAAAIPPPAAAPEPSGIPPSAAAPALLPAKARASEPDGKRRAGEAVASINAGKSAMADQAEPGEKAGTADPSAPVAPKIASGEPGFVIPALAAESKSPVRAQPQKPAPKKQWKVVDINDLDPVHAPPPGMVADRQPRLLRFGFGRGNTGTSESPPPARGEESRLKINLTTQNR